MLVLAKGDGAELSPLDRGEEVLQQAADAIEEEEGQGQPHMRHGDVQG